MVQLLRLVSGWEIKESEVSTTIWTLWYGKDNPFSTSWRLSCSLWQVFCSDVLQWIVHLMHFLAFWIYIIFLSSFYYVLFSGKFLLRMSYVERSIHSLASCAAAHIFQACRHGIPVRTWTWTGLPGRRPLAGRQDSRSTTPAVIVDVGIGYPVYATVRSRRPIVSRRHGTNMEQFATAKVTSSNSLQTFKRD